MPRPWTRCAPTSCVPLYNLMEDAATAEISRAQIWQWIRHGGKLQDGRSVDRALCQQMLAEELQKLRKSAGEEAYAKGRFEDAAQIFRDMIDAPKFVEFLTLPAYDKVVAEGR